VLHHFLHLGFLQALNDVVDLTAYSLFHSINSGNELVDVSKDVFAPAYDRILGQAVVSRYNQRMNIN